MIVSENMKYTYHDNNQNGIVIFVCVATSILDADKLYEKATGNNPVKQSYVGCQITAE